MNWTLLLCLIFLSNGTFSLARNFSSRDLKKLIKLLKRRNTLETDDDIVDMPRSVEDLPRAEPIKPGHTLIQPSLGMLKSAIKYPQKDVSGTAVYGNVKNLGLTFGNMNERLLYSSFRKSNDLLVALLQVIKNIRERSRNKSNPPVIVIEIDPAEFKHRNQYQITDEKEPEIENDANEVLDSVNSGEDVIETRRKSHRKKRSKFRDRDSSDRSSSTDDSSSSSRSSDYERNPGNPFTVHKDKYRQNWLWNHFMDGDHMNVNPYAPQFSSTGPSGASLFFGRKWWYFNQDDFKPLN